MSFIYNKNLLKEFEKIAQAQSVDRQTLEIAKNLIPLLKDQLEGKDVFTANKINAELNTTNLKDLDSFLFFLFFNKITHNGSVIVDDYSAKADDKNYIPYSKKIVMPGEPDKYFINKNSLIVYLKSLLSTDNPVLKVMINKLIDSVNSQLNVNMSKDTLLEPANKNIKNQVGFAIEDNSTEKTQSGQQLTQEQASKAQKEQSVLQTSNQLLVEIAENLPFDNEDIDFQRIERFFQNYEKLNEFRSYLTPGLTPGRVAATTGIAVARDAIKKVESVTANGTTSNILLTGLTPQKLTTLLKQPWIVNYKYFIEYIILVLNNTRDVVSEFYNAYVRKSTPDSRVTMSDDLAQLVRNQTAIYNYNFNQLQDIASRLGQVKR